MFGNYSSNAGGVGLFGMMSWGRDWLSIFPKHHRLPLESTLLVTFSMAVEHYPALFQFRCIDFKKSFTPSIKSFLS